MKHIYFVRHGETEGNVGKYFQIAETKLTEEGHAGARALAQRFLDIKVDLLLASTFVRAQQTAQYISEAKDIPVVTSAFFHEKLHAASIRGMSRTDPKARAYQKEHSEKFWTKDWRPEGAENFFDVRKRIEKGINLIQESEAENIVVVAHGDFIRMTTALLLLGQHSDVQLVKRIVGNMKLMSNVGISDFLYEDGRWSLVHYNDHAHFAE